MKRELLVGLVAAAVVAAAVYYYWPAHVPAPPSPPPAAAAGPGIEHPIVPAAGEPLPALAASDGPLATAVAALLQSPTLPELVYPDRMVRRWVATIDNLPREQIAADVRALRPPGGSLATRGEEPSLAIAPDNATRYARYLSLLAILDVHEAAALYRRYYPLFQQAYEDLGYPGKYFNDRVVAVIDHLLATPEVAEPIRLVRPSVIYKYADPKLESLSAGQKALLRLGRDNAAAVKVKLRALRAELATGVARR